MSDTSSFPNSPSPSSSSSTASSSPLISADELGGILGDERLRLFDVRGRWGGSLDDARRDYSAGHIPGAVFFDWTTLLLEPDVPLGLAPVASPATAAASFAALGISDDSIVVLYDDYHHMLAGRVWWAMRHLGFNNVRVLNGGWSHWSAQGGARSTEPSEPAGGGSFVPVANGDLRTTVTELLAEKGSSTLVDARSAAGYAGTDDDERSGHIPGALHLAFSEMLDEQTGLFKSRAELSELLNQQLPGLGSTPVISSCGSGYAGTVVLLALEQIGQRGSLYDDSFSGWKADPNLPVERS